MLVLSRKKNERVLIGDDVIVTVVDIRGNKVRLGIEAPKGVAIHREEVAEAIKRNSAGVASPPGGFHVDPSDAVFG